MRCVNLTFRNDLWIKSLDIGGNYIGIQGAKILGSLLKENKSLEKLVISRCFIGGDGVELIAKAIGKSRCLKSLDISFNNIGDKGMTTLSKKLKSNEFLCEINFESNNVGEDGFTALAHLLKSNNAISSLNLTSNNLNGSILHLIIDNICANPKSSLDLLNLSRNGISDLDSQCLSRLLTENFTLQTLNLSHNNLGYKSSLILEESLNLNLNLRDLNIEQNIEIEDHEANSLALLIFSKENIRSTLCKTEFYRYLHHRDILLDHSILHQILFPMSGFGLEPKL
jgi:Ran GTPase-activating protein (RanGAP) involved in mRNA processing and transport